MTDITTLNTPATEPSLTSRLAFVFGIGEPTPAALAVHADLDATMLRSAGLTPGQIALARRVTSPVR